MGEHEPELPNDDLVDHVEEERLAILGKYDKGFEDSGSTQIGIGLVEDPANEIYHTLDHYGFIQKTRLPEKIAGEELKKRELEVKRSDKWIKMYKSWPKYKNTEKFIKRTFKGIPNKVRGLFWQLILDLPKVKKEQEGKYTEMYQLARLHSPDIRQIDLDVNRTYRDHIMFRERYSVKQRSLFNILAAYSVYNSEVGYCQGMSQIAAVLLMYMDEEDAFWGLAQLMTDPKFGMHGFFVLGFPKLLRFTAHHEKILQVLLPKLKKHFERHLVDSGIYTLKWFFQIFLDRIPFELALRIWDVFLLDGDKVLTCGAYTILKVQFKPLLSRKSMDDILGYLQTNLPVKFGVDYDKVMEAYQKCMEDLRRKRLDVAGEATDAEFPKKPFGVIENIPKPTQHPQKETADERIKKEIEAKRLQRAAAQLATDETDEFDNDDENEDNDNEHENQIVLGNEDEEDEEEPEETSMIDKASASRISLAATSIASSSIADSPRNIQRANFFAQNMNSSNVNNSNSTNGCSSNYTSSHFNTSSSVNEKRPSPPPPPRQRKSPQPHQSLNSNSSNTITTMKSTTTSTFIEQTITSTSTASYTSTSSQSSFHGGEAVRIHVPYHQNNQQLSSSNNANSHSPSSSSTTTSNTATTVVNNSSRNGLDISKNDPNRIKIEVSSS